MTTRFSLVWACAMPVLGCSEHASRTSMDGATDGVASAGTGGADASDDASSTLTGSAGGTSASSAPIPETSGAPDATSSAAETGSSGGTEPRPIDPAPVGCVTSVEPGEHVFTCEELATTVTVPEVCITQACGVILDIHGASMTAQQEDNNTNMRALGLERGYIVVQPTTDLYSWSAGHEVRIKQGLDDVMDAFDADRDRIHVMGFSAGGGVTWVMLCTYAETFASAAPAAATGQYLGAAPVCFGSNPPSHELDIFYMNGETDPFESMDYVDQLTDKIVTDWNFGPPMMIEGDGTFSRLRHTNDSGTVFDLVLHTYETDEVIYVPPLLDQPLLGHCYPGSTDHTASEPNQIAGYGCKGENAFHWGEMAIDFFESHPKH